MGPSPSPALCASGFNGREEANGWFYPTLERAAPVDGGVGGDVRRLCHEQLWRCVDEVVADFRLRVTLSAVDRQLVSGLAECLAS